MHNKDYYLNFHFTEQNVECFSEILKQRKSLHSQKDYDNFFSFGGRKDTVTVIKCLVGELFFAGTQFKSDTLLQFFIFFPVKIIPHCFNFKKDFRIRL